MSLIGRQQGAVEGHAAACRPRPPGAACRCRPWAAGTPGSSRSPVMPAPNTSRLGGEDRPDRARRRRRCPSGPPSRSVGWRRCRPTPARRPCRPPGRVGRARAARSRRRWRRGSADDVAGDGASGRCGPLVGDRDLPGDDTGDVGRGVDLQAVPQLEARRPSWPPPSELHRVARRAAGVGQVAVVARGDHRQHAVRGQLVDDVVLRVVDRRRSRSRATG